MYAHGMEFFVTESPTHAHEVDAELVEAFLQATATAADEVETGDDALGNA